MDKNDNLKDRTKKFALRVIKLVESLPKTVTGKTIGNQLIRSGTSVAANYRAACRARSTAEFISKLGIVEEETDESAFWIEMLVDSETLKAELVANLLDEANQLTAIWVSSINTARGKKRS
ncbi:MAG TPA: four helix bundle protein [Pyrinomonadaceae bacterium]|nr:four helix bundle protein [Acidobacteriota bacterium]HQZ96249.1 four helix bundle protein [Pyrinomonadaceae bacterium]